MGLTFLFIIVIIQVLFLIPSYFIYRKILKRRKVKRIVIKTFLMTIILPFIYTLILMLTWGFVIEPIIRSKKLDSKEWVENKSSRYRMENDIKNNNLLIGKTKKEVLAILGEPYTDNFLNCNNCIAYKTYDPNNIGSFGITALVIDFNGNGIVIKVHSEST